VNRWFGEPGGIVETEGGDWPVRYADVERVTSIRSGTSLACVRCMEGRLGQPGQNVTHQTVCVPPGVSDLGRVIEHDG
jgi:hypothetical protein